MAGWSNCLYVSSGTVMENCTFWGKWKIFLSFPHIMWNNFANSNEIARVVNLAFIISSRTFWKNVVWMKQFTGFHQISTLNKKHWVEFSHLLPTRRGEHFGGEPYFEMIFYFNWGEWHLVQLRTTIYVSRRTFLATFFLKISFLFWFSDFDQKSCKIFREMPSAIFSELTSMCTEEQFEKTSGLWEIQIFLIISGTWAITQYNFGKSGSGKLVKNAFYSSRETFWRKQIFRKLLQKWLVSELGQKTFGRMLKLPLRVQWNSDGKLYFLGKMKVFL